MKIALRIFCEAKISGLSGVCIFSPGGIYSSRILYSVGIKRVNLYCHRGKERFWHRSLTHRSASAGDSNAAGGGCIGCRIYEPLCGTALRSGFT